MHVVFYTSPKPRRQAFAQKFATGARRHGDTAELRPLGAPLEPGPHVAVVIGNKMRHNLQALVDRTPPCPIVIVDKAYPRDVEDGFPRNGAYARATINTGHPVAFAGKLGCPDDRRRLFDWRAKPWRERGLYVVVAGAGRAFYERAGIADADISVHLARMVERVQQLTNKIVIFRPKPNMPRTMWQIAGSDAPGDRGPLSYVLGSCWAVVAEDSALTFQALLRGIPSVVLGDAPTRPISSNSIEAVARPYLAPAWEVEAFLNDLAYFQYNEAEYERGTAWEFLRGLLSPAVT